MKIPFQKYVETKSRNLVIHNIINENEIISKIKPTDIIFFDDCTYDQYCFIKNNLSVLQSIPLVIGFSTGLYREESNQPITGITTKELHDGFHRGDMSFKNGFMTLNEIIELSNLDNIYIALHGHDHLFLENEKPYKRSLIFRSELNKSLTFLNQNDIKTNIFVYPYDFFDCMSTEILKNNGFFHIYPSKNNSRIYIEDVIE